jgi:hypothetical protein
MPQVNAHLGETKKLQELILYVAKMSEGDPAFGAIKLNKLLFYSDFRAFLDARKSITRRRRSVLCSQSRVKSVRSIRPSSRSATAKPFCP